MRIIVHPAVLAGHMLRSPGFDSPLAVGQFTTEFTKELRVSCTRTERDLTGCRFTGTNPCAGKPAALSRRTSGYG
jgi:hypothetical protein